MLNDVNPVLNPGLHPHVIAKMVNLYLDLRSADANTLPQLLILAQNILVDIVSLSKKGKDKTYEYIYNLCDVLTENLASNISTKYLIESTGKGYEKARKLFKTHMGISPGEYRISRRLDVAREYLLVGNMSVGMIAEELGYADSFVFSKQFKSRVGLSPINYRKIHG